MSFPSGSTRSRTPPPKFLQQIRKKPFLLFGLPFIGIIVVSSFALESFAQTRYDYQRSKVRSLGMEEELGMSKDRRKVDLKDEYYRLNNPNPISSLDDSLSLSLSSSPSTLSSDSDTTNPQPLLRPPINNKRKNKFSMIPISQDDLENVRVPRPEGVPEWGGGRTSEEAPLKGQRKEDRWV